MELRHEKLVRRQKVADLICRGVYSPTAIANRTGTTVKTASLDVRAVFAVWGREGEEVIAHKLGTRIKQLEWDQQEFANAWEQSKGVTVEVQTTYNPRPCEDCKGTGFNGDKWCGGCGGEGTVFTETVTRKVKGSPGDPRYLEGFVKATKEICKLEDHYKYAGVGRRGRRSG